MKSLLLLMVPTPLNWKELKYLPISMASMSWKLVPRSAAWYYQGQWPPSARLLEFL
jgi:hypothetical protein